MKAVLIVVDEMPQGCLFCDFHKCTDLIVGYPNFCVAHDMDEIDVDLDHERENWCPLRPLPDKATPENSDMGISWNLGWNACLEAITGGEEE